MKDALIDFVKDELTSQFDEHVVLIAGDLAGTARTAAFAYAKEGNHIVVASDNDEAAMSLTDELLSRHVDATFVHVDTHNERDVQRVIDLTVKHYGHIDVEYRQ